jgi:hypothetical protein
MTQVAIGFAVTCAEIPAPLHLLEPQFNSDGHVISDYELGRFGWLMSAAFVSMAGAVGRDS